MSHPFSIAKLIADGRVRTAFQPLFAIRTGSVLGYEALSRGVLDLGNGCKTDIPPDTLFTLARAEDHCLLLDRLCREKAFANFAPHHRQCPELLLFINIDASLLHRNIIGSGHIERLASTYGIPPCNVVLEIIESAVANEETLNAFAERHRELGFLLALDDVGAGHSNLARIAALRPDVLKLDRTLVQNCDGEFHRREVIHALVALAKRIGALTVAEGVERQEEACVLFDLEVDMVQGFLFARPGAEPSPGSGEATLRSMSLAHAGLQLRRMSAREHCREELLAHARSLASHLDGKPTRDVAKELAARLAANGAFECLFTVDETGVQTTPTVCREASMPRRLLYRPALPGTDHSCKEYILPFKAGATEYVSAPYISQATGHLCVTVATGFRCAGGRHHILCADALHAAC